MGGAAAALGRAPGLPRLPGWDCAGGEAVTALLPNDPPGEGDAPPGFWPAGSKSSCRCLPTAQILALTWQDSTYANGFYAAKVCRYCVLLVMQRDGLARKGRGAGAWGCRAARGRRRACMTYGLADYQHCHSIIQAACAREVDTSHVRNCSSVTRWPLWCSRCWSALEQHAGKASALYLMTQQPV